MSKMLLAIDDSPGAMKAVGYAARQFSRAKDLEIVLIHVLPNLPAVFWDDGHILSKEEKKERKKIVDKWLADCVTKMEPVFREATALLTAQGIKKKEISRKTISDSIDTANSMLEEAKDSGAQTIVLGRHGNPGGARSLAGSVTNKVVGQGTGITVIIVDS